MATAITKPTSLDFILMGLTAIIWASAFIAIKVVVPETGPWWLAAFRVGIAFIVLIPYVIWRGWIWPSSNKVWVMVFIMALFNVVLPFFFISWAETRIDAGITALLVGTGPFMALIGSHIFTQDDKITPQKAFAVAMGFAGILVVVGGDTLSGLGGSTLLAQMAAVGAAFSYTVSGILVRKIDLPPIRLGFFAFGAGFAQLLVLAFLFEGPPSLAYSTPVVLTLLYLGVFPTALGQLLRLTLIQRVGYAVFALTLNLIPVIGVALGALLLGEVISTRTVIALVLVMAGVWVSQQSGKSKT